MNYQNIFVFLEPIKIKDANRFSTNRSEIITLPDNKQKEATERYTIKFILHKSAIKRHLRKDERIPGYVPLAKTQLGQFI